MSRVLLLLPTTTYRTEAFLDAAARLGVDVTVASEQPNTLQGLNPAGLLTLDFDDVEKAIERVREFQAAYPIDAVVPVDSQVVVLGAAISAALGIRHNSLESAMAARDKHRMRERLAAAGVACPRFTLCSFHEDVAALAERIEYPCVVKPLALAGSQGVIRANDARELIAAVRRVAAILDHEHAAPRGPESCPQGRGPSPACSPETSRQFLVEQFMAGPEVALEGMLVRGKLRVLTLFDKPDPLDGPFFEETIYVTPSRLSAPVQQRVAECAQAATRALGLTEGPVHAELRLGDGGPWVIEVNARSIGGRCSRALRFGTGMSLEELILRHALDEKFDPPEREGRPSGVMMIPIPREGRLRQVRGLDEANEVSGIEEVTVTAHIGEHLVPLPEGSRYLGFIFARADSPEAVEAALRASHARLEFVIEPVGAHREVPVDPAPPAPSRSDGRIYSYVVRYGAMGHVARVGSVRPIACHRGDRVVLSTARGVEVAEVLEPPQNGADDSGENKPAGELLRVMTDDDRRQEQSLGDLHHTVLRRCQDVLAECRLPVTAVDAEQLLDGQTMIIYYLGQPTEKLGPVAVQLARTAGNCRIQFQPIETAQPAPTEVTDQPSQPHSARSKEELIKESSGLLRGTIAAELAGASEKFTADDVSLVKFHGIYQQDDRDARKERRAGAAKVGKKYIFMVRTKIPGGRMTAGQLLSELDICDRLGNSTLRITTRQGLQLHGVVKGNLWQTVHEINQSMLTTLGACGDVVRNVMCCPAPHRGDRVHRLMQATAGDIATHLAPRTPAYYEIWIDGQKQLEQSPQTGAEPIYGKAYLPRKFKIGIARPEDNCIDVYTQDIGLVAIAQAGQLLGYNVLVGGGLGTTPSVKDTFPRLADPMAFVPYAEVLGVVTAIVEVQRDFGNRENRRRARMKYLVEEWGVGRFKAKVEEYLGGRTLEEPRPVEVYGIDDHLGWQPQGDGKYYLGLFVENGRIKDGDGMRLKGGLRAILERFRMPVRLTPQQSILLCDLESGWRDPIIGLLGEHGIKTYQEISLIRRHAMACPALPTCGLAITESERVLPGVLDELQIEAAKLGLEREAFTVRMTGCPNGCSRPYTADVGLVGKAAGKYTILVGGNMLGDRLNVIYKDMVPLEELVREILPLLVFFKRDRRVGESLGDFCHRQGIDELLRFAAK
jgi:sulfite reductase (ferredoxin)